MLTPENINICTMNFSTSREGMKGNYIDFSSTPLYAIHFQEKKRVDGLAKPLNNNITARKSDAVRFVRACVRKLRVGAR